MGARQTQVCTSVDLGLLPMLCPGLQHMSLIYTTDQCVRIRGNESWTWDFECLQWTYHAWCTWRQDRHSQVCTSVDVGLLPCFGQGFNTCRRFTDQCVRIRGQESWTEVYRICCCSSCLKLSCFQRCTSSDRDPRRLGKGKTVPNATLSPPEWFCIEFMNHEGKSPKTVSINHNFWREKTAKSNQGPCAYLYSTLPLGQISCQMYKETT